MNQFMHPRNKYRIPSNFTDLAIEYPEFREISNLVNIYTEIVFTISSLRRFNKKKNCFHLQDVNGKVTVNFKDEKTLRILTKCLLHKDFRLDVILPPDKLIPTLPLRLNYILWIEDILKTAGITSNVIGIDIGW